MPMFQTSLWNSLYADDLFNRTLPHFTLEIDDKVRVKIDKGVFGKGFTPRFSQEIFTVVKRIPRRPPVYELIGESGDQIIGKWLEVSHKSPRQDA